MKKLFSTLIIVMLVLALATSAYAMGMVGGEITELVLGENVAEFVVEYYEDYDEYFGMPAMFQWVAPEAGTLTIDFSDEDEFAAYANIYVFDLEGDQSWYGIEEKGGQVSMQVSEGDTVMMEVGCMDMLTEAGTIFFNFTMTMGEPIEPGTTQAEPILVEFEWNDEYSEAFATVTVPAGKTLWFGSYGVSGLELSVNGEFYCVLPAMDRMNWGPVTFSLTNDTEADATYELKLTWPLGTDYNPDELPVNDSVTLEVPENLQGGYTYQWFATANGTLTVTVEGEFWTLNVNNWGDPDSWKDDIYGDNLSAVEGSENTVTMRVKAGDQVVIYVGSMDEEYNNPATTLTVTTTFVEAGSVEGPCEHTNADLDYEYYEDDSGFDVVLVCPDCGEILERYAAGEHEMNPILVDFLYDEATNTASATVTVPAGESLWFGSYNIGGMLMTINGEEYGVLQDMGHYSPVVFTLTNDTDADVTYEILLTWPLGSDYNPGELPVNDSTELYLPENSYEFAYQWFATADGELTITIEGENWLFHVNNYTSYVYGDCYYDCYGDANTVTIQVAAGDEIMLYVGTLDADWNTPEATLTITTVFACAHKNLVHVEAVVPGCYEEGNIEHWYCEDCEIVWADEALTQVTNHKSVILPATHQNVVHVEAKAPSCYEEGNVEYWYCEDCVTVWVDEAMLQISNMMSIVLPATHQHVVHVEAVAPTCTEHGNVEYWYCEDCLTVWVDEAMLQISNMKNIVDPAIGHNYVDGVCANCGENDKNVPETGDMIALACVLSAVSGMTIIALPKKKEN